jgi:hypothetical protein
MQTTTGYRTKGLMSQSRAERFARCLAANGRFSDVQVVESGRAKCADCAHYVYYTPRNVTRHKQILQDAQNSREARAREQRESYEFHLDESGLFYWCLNLRSLEVYETTVHGCDCPDATYNLSRTGIQCKHALMLQMQLQEEAEALEIERQIEEQQEQEAAEEFARQGYEQAEAEACDAHARWCAEMQAKERQHLSNMHNDFGGGDW